MKKLLALVLMFVIAIDASPNHNNFSLLNYFDGEYCAYTDVCIDKSSINLGFCYASYTLTKPNMDLVGESMIIKNLEPIVAIKSLNATIVNSEYLDCGASVIYAYSPLINAKVNVCGKNVNIQIACYDDYCVIGWPMILGSF